MCSWSSWGNRVRSKAQQREYSATHKKSALTGCPGLWPTSYAPSLLLHYPHGNLLFQYQRKITSFWFLFAVSYSATIHLGKEPEPLEVLGAAGSWSNPISRLNQPHSLSLSSQGKCFSLGHLRHSLLSCSLFTTFMYWVAQRWTQYSKDSQTNAKEKGISASPICWLCSWWHSPGHSAFIPARILLAQVHPGVPQALSPCSTELLLSQAIPTCFLLDVGLSLTQGRAGVLTEFHDIYCQFISPT